MGPVISTPTPAIDTLLMEAQVRAAVSIGEVEATQYALNTLAERTRTIILEQVARGLWIEFGVAEYDHIGGLRIAARLGKTLLGEPPIVVEFDFSKTRLPALIVESRRRE